MILESHKKITIGLFGTCDNSEWRLPFIKEYERKKITYFNPDMGDNWHSGMIAEENYYLNNAEVILFPILAESLGSGSLGEVGFSVQGVLRNINNGKRQFLIVLIDDECTDERKTDQERKRSTKDRALVKSKFKKSVSYPVITLVNTMDEMMVLSKQLYEFLTQGYSPEETNQYNSI